MAATDTQVDMQTDTQKSQIDDMLAMVNKARSEVGQVVFGQQQAVDYSLITLLCGSHGLIVGLPGLAKTQLVSTLGTVLGLANSRIQFTPDLMPSDILGSEILDIDDAGKRSFRFVQGPVFNQLVMADEINRASPRTQSAMLQAMQERSVSVNGVTYDLPAPFHVLATQNPIEQEGTFGLPEAQLDRFLMEIIIDYPDEDTEREILVRTTSNQALAAQQVLSPGDLERLQVFVRSMPIGEQVVDAILALTRGGRPDALPKELSGKLTWGPGPRAGQALMLCCRARALMDGRLAPSLDDVAAMADPVLRHRLGLGYAARAEGLTPSKVVDFLLRHVGVSRG